MARTRPAIGPRTLSLLGAAVLAGCTTETHSFLNPASLTAESQRDLMIWAFGLMLVVLIPVWVMAIWFPWRYREGNSGADYRPDWAHSNLIEAVVWIVPAILVVAISALVWVYTHRLDPYATPVARGEPLHVQAISLDWKWVFLYPDNGVASVNTLVLPEGRPVEMSITSDTVMNALYLPGLAGQIYAMAGMVTHLNFAPDHRGHFTGRNMQYSGDGFPDHRFDVSVESAGDFQRFVREHQGHSPRLSTAAYRQLANAHATARPAVFGGFPPRLFDQVVHTYCATDCDQTTAGDRP